MYTTTRAKLFLLRHTRRKHKVLIPNTRQINSLKSKLLYIEKELLSCLAFLLCLLLALLLVFSSLSPGVKLPSAKVLGASAEALTNVQETTSCEHELVKNPEYPNPIILRNSQYWIGNLLGSRVLGHGTWVNLRWSWALFGYKFA